MNNIMKNFELLCTKIQEREEVTYGFNEIEDLLFEMLNYLKLHKEYKISFIKFFTDKIIGSDNNALVYGKSIYLIQVIQYCMRELQWAEIKDAAIERKGNSDNWRVIGTMDAILEVYESEWPGDDLYEYYSRRIHE